MTSLPLWKYWIIMKYIISNTQLQSGLLLKHHQLMILNLSIAQTDYTFIIYPIEIQFNRIAGIYIFLTIPHLTPSIERSNSESHNSENIHHPATCHSELVKEPQYSLLYVGITNNFRGRFSQHHKIRAAQELGMTHIGILKIASVRKRKKIEREILKYLNPPLNQTWL